MTRPQRWTSRLTLSAIALLIGACAHTTTHPPTTTPATNAPAPDPLRDRWLPIGASEDGRPILATTLGRGTVRLLLIGSIHGDEAEARAAFATMQRALRTSPIPQHATVRIIKDLNPDGSAAGTRTNSRGVDLNRNWPATNFRPARQHGDRPLSERETRAAYNEYQHHRPDLVVVLHSARAGPFVNHDGPQPRTKQLATTFATGAKATDPRWRVVDSMGYPTPGSMGSFIGLDEGVPILTIELRRNDPDGPRDQQAILAGLTAAIEQLAQDR